MPAHRLLSLLLFIACFCLPLSAQSIRGVVLDKITSAPMIGATVDIPSLDPPRGATCDTIGAFVIRDLPAGRYNVRIRYPGYETEGAPDVLVSNGKDAELLVELEETTQAVQTVTVSGTKKDKSVNKLAKLSAIALNPEAVSRYSSGRCNIARMASNFAGIGATDDFQNQIVVRGNTPTALLWRLEGVPIPSPGHLKTFGNTGGGFNALNPNLLGQSDFLTGAFPAEYGNTIAGVMDLGFRGGNKERYEGMAQIGAWSGVEAAVEGPLLKKWNGSFMVGYRYSFIDLLHHLGLDVAGRYAPQYQDLNWKMDFNKGRQRLVLFGLAGKSHVFVSGPDEEVEKAYTDPSDNFNVYGKLSTTGLRYQVMLDSVSYLRTIVSFSTSDIDDKSYTRFDAQQPFVLTSSDQNHERTGRLSSIWQRRQTKRLTLRGGVLVQANGLDSRLDALDESQRFVTARHFNDRLWLLEGFAQMQYKVKKRYSVNVGLHAQHLPFNGKSILEPRTALKLKLPDDNDLVFAYGYHSQTPLLQALLFADSTGAMVNRNLDFIRSHQGGIAWTKKWPSFWNSRVEAYYQWQSRVPVQRVSSGYSQANAGASYYSDQPAPLVSEGNGVNYGLELTLSRRYNNGFYSILTGSLFNSCYRGSDGIWRNTAFNTGYILNVLAGKEIRLGHKTVLTLDGKFSTSGGRWYTPIDLSRSIAAGQELEDDNRPFSLQYPAFLRLDGKVGVRYNTRRFTHTLFLDVTNVTNRQNVYAYRYFRNDDFVRTQYQLGLTPDFVYRVQF
ncbi:MAG: TonB-dependent receptor [Saprospiraceae bacterium]|nr:TonB-dependent receptor [Saprospiraceae bacterium]